MKIAATALVILLACAAYAQLVPAEEAHPGLPGPDANLASAAQGVIWSQPPGSTPGILSQDYPPDMDTLDCMGADVVVFDDAAYRITGIHVWGMGGEACPGFHVRVFSVTADGAPDTELYYAYAEVSGPEWTWELYEPFEAEQGVPYAISIQADNPSAYPEWGWATTPTIAGPGMAWWINPGGGWGVGTDWLPAEAHGFGPFDFSFELFGERTGSDLPEVALLLPNELPYASDRAGVVPLQAYDTADTGAVVRTIFEFYDPHEQGPFLISVDEDPSETQIDAMVEAGEGRGWYTEWFTEGLFEGWYTLHVTMETADVSIFGELWEPVYIDPEPIDPEFIQPMYEDVFWVDSFFDVYTLAPDVVSCEFLAQPASRVFTRNAELKNQGNEPSCMIYAEAAIVVELVRKGKVNYPGLIKPDGTVDPAVQAKLVAELKDLKKYDPAGGTRPSDAEDGMNKFLKKYGTNVEADTYYDHWYDDMDFEEVKERFEDSRTVGAVLFFYGKDPKTGKWYGHAVSLTSVHEPAGRRGTGYKLDFMDSRDGKIHTVTMSGKGDDTFTDWDTGAEVEIGGVEIIRGTGGLRQDGWFTIGFDNDPTGGWGIEWGPSYAEPGIYFVRAVMTDSQGFTDECTTVVIIPDVQVSPGSWFKPLWTMFSVPLQPLDEDPYAVFPVDPTNRLYRWDNANQQWSFFDPVGGGDDFGIELGEGYMFFMNVVEPPFEMAVVGTRQHEDFVMVLERAGRSLVGCPFIYDVPWGALEVSEDHNTYFPLTDARAWAIVGQYGVYWDNDLRTWAIAAPAGGDDDMMRPWRGYFLWALKDHVFIKVPKR